MTRARTGYEGDMPEENAATGAGEKGGGHVIVCGLGQVGFRVVRLLREMGQPVTVITLPPREAWLWAARNMGARVIIGDARSAERLLEADIASARSLVLTPDQDLVNVEAALDARRLREDVPIVIRLFDQTLARSFERMFPITRSLDMSDLAAPSFVAAALGARATGSFTYQREPYIVARMRLEARSPLVGLTVSEAHERLRIAVLLRCAVAEGGAEAAPDSRTLLQEGDRITAVGTAEDLDRATLEPLIPRPPRLRGGLLAHLSDLLHLPMWGPLVRQIWKNAPVALRSALLFLILMLMVSVAVFHFGLGLSVVDAIYFMVTTVTTTGYGDIHPGEANPWIKLYASLVMLSGAAALAIIYSIITDFIVTARFEQILGRQRYPRRNHIVVVGLGNIGYRVVNELRRIGARVLAVDRNADGPFVSTVRAHTPVLVGDARVPEILQAAAVRHAAAVISVTNDDAANLGIGLLAEESSQNVYTVARLFDAEFAAKIEADLAIDKALSASRIAAPTFAAAAVYQNACHAFVLGETMFIVHRETVGEDWEGLTPDRLRDEHGLLLVARWEPSGAAVAGQLGDALKRGQTVLTIRQQHLEVPEPV